MNNSVIRCKTLPDAVKLIKKSHTQIGSNNGVYALKLIRQADGVRIPFEEMRGVRIKDFIVDDDNTLVVEQRSHGREIRGVKGMIRTCAFSSRIFLTNLAMINVYDYSAEFLTMNSIDFVYIQDTKEASVVMLSEWLNDQSGILRAQWFKDSEVEKVLDNVGQERKLKREPSVSRNIDLDMNL